MAQLKITVNKSLFGKKFHLAASDAKKGRIVSDKVVPGNESGFKTEAAARAAAERAGHYVPARKSPLEQSKGHKFFK